MQQNPTPRTLNGSGKKVKEKERSRKEAEKEDGGSKQEAQQTHT